MGTQTDQLQCLGVRLAVDQHQIRLDVTVSMIRPVSGQCVIAMAWLQRGIIGQGCDHRDENSIKPLCVLPFGLALIVSAELTCPLNLPHADRQ